MNIVLLVLSYVLYALYLIPAFAVAGLGVFGLVTAATTRDDAFLVVDRNKQNWMLLTGAAAALGAVSIAMPGTMMLWIIGAVIVGIYWQDVRPAIRDVLDNSGGSW